VLFTVTVTLAELVELPAALYALAYKLWLPLAMAVVSQVAVNGEAVSVASGVV
jgi:hypothetical protein